MAKEKYLIIVESPNKCSSIRNILKGTEYENAVIMASVGHIMKLRDGGKYWNTGIDIENNFEPDYAVSPDKKEVVAKLKEQVKFADKVFLMSDEDREGEVISYSLKRFLKIPDSKYVRVTTHEITKPAVLKALSKPRKIDDKLVDAGIARSCIDKLLGYRVSPISRKAIQARSVGRCQSVGLQIICDREQEILNFKPENYYELYLNFKKNATEFKAKCVAVEDKKLDDKVKDKELMMRIHSKCGDPFTIENIETRDSISNPKKPFTTSSFQQEVSSKLGISVKYAQSCAQKLFEGIEVGGEHRALITYIRTDSISISPDFVVELENYVKKNYGDKYFNKVKEYKADAEAQDAHEAIRVIDLEMTPEKLSSYIDDEKLLKVYKIIYQRTLQLAFKPAITAETTYTIDSHGVKFSMTSKELKFDGYKKVYGYEKEGDELIKETFSKGEVLKDTVLDLQAKQTKPKSRFSESTFIKELQTSGVGRPSTYSSILETIESKTRGYCDVKDGTLYPTELGMKLSEFLHKNFPDFINISYTSEMEEGLDKIANGKLDKLDFLKSFYEKLEESAKKVSPAEYKGKASTSDKVCPLCGKPMIYRTGRYGPFLGCSGYPKCKHIEKIVDKKE